MNTAFTAIGFANKFYTLWSITEETKPLGNGHSYIVTHYNYIKNISFDKETAMAKYPDAVFDENLRGMTRSWDTQKEVWDNVDTFRFGKYKYEKIDDSDLNYLAWYWDNIDGEHREYVGKILEANGYEIRTNTYTDYYGETHTSTYLMTPELLEDERIKNAGKNEILSILENNNPIEITFDRNPDYNGDCEKDNIWFHFAEVKENYYNGFEYYLPVVNGKQKRIKNKNLVIKNYNYTNDNGKIVVNIIDFEIRK